MIIIGAIIVIGFIANLSKPSSSTPNQNSTTQPVSTSVNIGDNVIIDKDTLIASTKFDLDEYAKLAVAGDTVGIVEMISNGQAFIVGEKTEALVIETDFDWNINKTIVRVRIMSGDQFGRSGWTLEDFCKKP